MKVIATRPALLVAASMSEVQAEYLVSQGFVRAADLPGFNFSVPAEKQPSSFKFKKPMPPAHPQEHVEERLTGRGPTKKSPRRQASHGAHGKRIGQASRINLRRSRGNARAPSTLGGRFGAGARLGRRGRAATEGDACTDARRAGSSGSQAHCHLERFVGRHRYRATACPRRLARPARTGHGRLSVVVDDGRCIAAALCRPLKARRRRRPPRAWRRLIAA